MRTDRVTICACASRSLMDKDKVVKVAALLKTAGYDVNLQPDLCKKVMANAPDMPEIASSIVAACYPRAVQSLFDSIGLKTNQLVDLRNGDALALLNQLEIGSYPDRELAQAEDGFREILNSFEVETGTDAWYPTLDKERCSDCGKCHDFCLFGVYTIEEGSVRVKQPANCKNNCPACARMCPTKAIIFPKYEKSPINGGLKEEEQALSVDPKMAYAQSLRARLEQRRAGVSFLKKDDK